MIALDTNILIRFIVRDDEKQACKVYKILKDAEKNNSQLFISPQVTLELIWVLKALYDFKRQDIILAIENLYALPILMFYNSDEIIEFIKLAKKSSYDLSDLLIGLSGQTLKCSYTLTFDKKASKSDMFKLLV